ncbi:MAG: hypothetical protein DRR06_18210, partial [Gammaproteobacteria bacterium]
MKVDLKRYILLFLIGCGFFLSSGTGWAKEYDSDGQVKNTFLTKSPGQEEYAGEISFININNFSTIMRRDGNSGILVSGNSGGFFPRGKVSVIYEDGLVWGGLVRGDDADPTKPAKRVGGSTYSTSTYSGWVTAGVPLDWENDPLARIFRIRGDYLSLSPSALQVDASEIFEIGLSDVSDDHIAAVAEAYARDWNEWPWEKGAPYYDDNDNGIMDGEEEPGLAKADQVLWHAFNDFDDSRSKDLAGAPGMKLEIQVTTFGYARTDELGDVYFKKFRMVNKSAFTIDSMYLAQWCDPDVGQYANDYSGCDTALSIMFAYNGTPTDPDFDAFKLPPGAVGYDFLQGPIVPSPGDTAIFNLEKLPDYRNLPMTSYSYFIAGSPIADPDQGEYTGTLQWYNMLQGFVPTATETPTESYLNTVTFEETKYPLAGDPVTFSGDIDGRLYGPGDRRMVMSSGPFTLNPDDVQELVVGVLGGISTDFRKSVGKLKFTDNVVQAAYDGLFDIAKPPVGPAVVSFPLQDKIVLDWGQNADIIHDTEEVPSGAWDFEGYSVFQYDDLGIPKLVANFDLINLTGFIVAPVFDDATGVLVVKPIRFGTNTGIQRYFVVEKDYINDVPLTPGKKYNFAVTAYNYNESNDITPSLESAPIIAIVTAQQALPGNDYYAINEQLTVTREAGASTGSVEAYVVNPSQTVTGDYAVTFADPTHFNLVRGTDTLISNYENENGLLSPLVEGLGVLGTGPTAGGFAGWDYDGNRWMSGVNWGGAGLFGGLDIGANFFGSTLDESEYVPVNTVWQDQASVDANGYVGKGQVYDRNGPVFDYLAQGIGEMPFSAFDDSDPANPRRVNVCFVEDPSGSNNLIWDMGWDGFSYPDTMENTMETGAREYLFIMNSSY